MSLRFGGEFPEIEGVAIGTLVSLSPPVVGENAFTIFLAGEIPEEKRREILRFVSEKFFRFLVTGVPEPAKGPQVIRGDLPPEEPSSIERVKIVGGPHVVAHKKGYRNHIE